MVIIFWRFRSFFYLRDVLNRTNSKPTSCCLPMEGVVSGSIKCVTTEKHKLRKNGSNYLPKPTTEATTVRNAWNVRGNEPLGQRRRVFICELFSHHFHAAKSVLFSGLCSSRSPLFCYQVFQQQKYAQKRFRYRSTQNFSPFGPGYSLCNIHLNFNHFTHRYHKPDVYVGVVLRSRTKLEA